VDSEVDAALLNGMVQFGSKQSFATNRRQRLVEILIALGFETDYVDIKLWKTRHNGFGNDSTLPQCQARTATAQSKQMPAATPKIQILVYGQNLLLHSCSRNISIRDLIRGSLAR
jgi:hypothetical protein